MSVPEPAYKLAAFVVPPRSKYMSRTAVTVTGRLKATVNSMCSRAP